MSYTTLMTLAGLRTLVDTMPKLKVSIIVRRSPFARDHEITRFANHTHDIICVGETAWRTVLQQCAPDAHTIIRPDGISSFFGIPVEEYNDRTHGDLIQSIVGPTFIRAPQ